MVVFEVFIKTNLCFLTSISNDMIVSAHMIPGVLYVGMNVN